MTDLRKAAEQALEALESCDAQHASDGGKQYFDDRLVEPAIIALRAAIQEYKENTMSKAYFDEDGKIQVKFDRFDFEQEIMDCWHVTTDIRTVSEYLQDAPLEEGREDKIANMLLGIEALYEAKFDKLFRSFEQLVREHAKTLDQ